MKRHITAVLVKRKPDNDLDIQVIDNFLDELDNIYKTIECQTIDIISRHIRGRVVDFIIDDEYLLTDKVKTHPTGINATNPMLERIYGSFLITGTGDEEGNLTSLSKLDIEAIFASRCIATGYDTNDKSKSWTFDTLRYTL